MFFGQLLLLGALAALSGFVASRVMHRLGFFDLDASLTRRVAADAERYGTAYRPIEPAAARTTVIRLNASALGLGIPNPLAAAAALAFVISVGERVHVNARPYESASSTQVVQGPLAA